MMELFFALVIVILLIIISRSYFHRIKPIAESSQNIPIGKNMITYIGHATALTTINNLRIITDPVLSNQIGWVSRRYVEPGIQLKNLDRIDAILISHQHIDHLDKPTLKRFSKDIPVIVPKNLSKRITKLDFKDVRGLTWWESTKIKDAIITAVPAKHRLSRPAGYIIQNDGKAIYFAGDTELFDGFTEIGLRFDIEVALLPIGDYRPVLWFIPGSKKSVRGQHMAPNDIPKAIEMLKCRTVIPIHWGTFKISATAPNEPLEWLKRIIKDNNLDGKVSILNHGEAKVF